MEAVIEKSTASEIWFDNLVAAIRADQLAYETKTAATEKAAMYESVINGDMQPLLNDALSIARKYYIQKMLVEYVKIVTSKTNPFTKIAVSFHNSGLLVWAEIPDGREDFEDDLIIAEARVNANYHQFGFNMDTTFVEECDRLPVPGHYQVLFPSKSA